MARKKRKKRKWPFILAALAGLGILLPVAFWLGLSWFVGAVVKSSDDKKPAARSAERISKEERQQLDRIIEKRKP